MYSALSILAIATREQLDQSEAAALGGLMLAVRLGTVDDVLLAGYHYDVVAAESMVRDGRRYGWSGGSRPTSE